LNRKRKMRGLESFSVSRCTLSERDALKNFRNRLKSLFKRFLIAP
jgi:hypothetical protein